MVREARSFKCPKCGETTASSDYCPECGEPLTIECTQCGTRWRFWTGIKFCPKCGTRAQRHGVGAGSSGKATLG